MAQGVQAAHQGRRWQMVYAQRPCSGSSSLSSRFVRLPHVQVPEDLWDVRWCLRTSGARAAHGGRRWRMVMRICMSLLVQGLAHNLLGGAGQGGGFQQDHASVPTTTRGAVVQLHLFRPAVHFVWPLFAAPSAGSRNQAQPRAPWGAWRRGFRGACAQDVAGVANAQVALF